MAVDATAESLRRQARQPRARRPPEAPSATGTGLSPYQRSFKERLRELGAMTVMAAQVMIATFTPPFVWRREFLRQSIFVLKASFIPMAIAVPIYAFGAPGTQGGGFLTELGAIDREGGFIVIGVIRDYGIFVVAAFVAGIYGTTVTAELGARKIREELDALQVMGVDPLHYMVVPRVLAFMFSLGLFTAFIVVFGTFGGFIAGTILYDATPAAFFTTFFLNSSWLDVVQSYGKGALIGFMIGIIHCYKGLAVKGGAEGVGRAVNESIVGSLVVIFSVNLAVTTLFAAMFPEIQVLR